MCVLEVFMCTHATQAANMYIFYVWMFMAYKQYLHIACDICTCTPMVHSMCLYVCLCMYIVYELCVYVVLVVFVCARVCSCIQVLHRICLCIYRVFVRHAIGILVV